MAIEGNLELFNLPEILQMVAAQNKTGILTVQGESDIVAISFKDGQVVAADALNQTVEDGLGQVLASQGLVSPSDFSVVSGEHEKTGKRLLDLLIERGLLDRSQLLEALRAQTYQLLVQLLRWDHGEFKFYSGDEVAYEDGFYAISVEELLIRSVTDLGADGQGAKLPDLETAYTRLSEGPTVRVVGVDGDGPISDGSGVWLDQDGQTLLDRLDGRTTAGTLAKQTGLGDYKVLFALYRLLQGGVVQAVAPPQEEPRPEPAPGPALAPVEMPEPEPSVFDIDGLDEPVLDRGPGPRPVEMPAPEDLAPRRRKVRPPRQELPPAAWSGIVATLGALAAAAALVVGFIDGPRRALLPFTLQPEIRVVENQRRASLQRIDLAARTYFLLEGHYPDTLQEMVDLRLLPGRSRHDPLGRLLAYSADDLSYELTPVDHGVLITDLSVREAITGDFLLDPDFLKLPEGSGLPPLVLLD